MREILENMQKHMRARTCHAFVLVGNVGDRFLDVSGRNLCSADEALREAFPNHAHLRLEAHAGLVSDDASAVKAARKALGIDDAPAGNDAASRARAALDAHDDDDTIVGEGVPALESLPTLLKTTTTKFLVYLPHLANLASNGPTATRTDTVAAELLAAQARRSAVAAAGHLIVAAVKNAGDVHPMLAGRESGFLQLAVLLPDEEARARVAAIVRAEKDEVPPAEKKPETTPLKTGDTLAEGWSKAGPGDLIVLAVGDRQQCVKVRQHFDGDSLGLMFTPESRAWVREEHRIDVTGLPLSAAWTCDGKRLRSEHPNVKMMIPIPEGSFLATKADAAELDLSKPIVIKRPAPAPVPAPIETKTRAGTLGDKDIARLTGGLMILDIIRSLRLHRAEKRQPTFASLTRMKRDLVEAAYGHLLTFKDTPYGFEGIGGLKVIKDEFRRVVAAIKAGNLNAVPMGIALMGPPGTGKTALAEALARECGFAFAEVRSQRSMWNGQTENHTQTTLDVIRALSPIIVFRDEVDQEDSGRDGPQGDSGVSARIRQAWMKFLSDPSIQGRVLVVSASNRPDLLDPALKRSGRTDLRLPVLMPDAAALEEIYQVMFDVQLRVPTSIRSFAKFAKESAESGLSGADVKAIIQRAYVLADGGAVENRHLSAALDDFRPAADQESIKRMSKLALDETSFRSFIPKNARTSVN